MFRCPEVFSGNNEYDADFFYCRENLSITCFMDMENTHGQMAHFMMETLMRTSKMLINQIILIKIGIWLGEGIHVYRPFSKMAATNSY